VKVAIVIGHVGGPAGGGGGPRQALELALGLVELGHDVTVACHDHDPESAFDDPAVRELDIRSVRRHVEMPAGVVGITGRHWAGMRRVAALIPPGTDAVNAHDTPALRAGALAARRLGVPHVWTRNDESVIEQALIPDETIQTWPGLHRRVPRFVLFATDMRDARAARAVTVLDGRNARMVQRTYRRPATIVQSGPRPDFFERHDRDAARRRLGVPDGVFLALGFGLLFPHRRFEDLIDAIALLRDDAPDVRALILGSDQRAPGYANELAGRIERLGLADRVELGRRGVSDHELRDAYAAADVYVFPNRRQTWGLAPLEALAAGTPVIVSRGAGVHEVLEGRPGVTVVPAEDPGALAGALRAARAAGPVDLEPTREWIRTELSRRAYASRMAALLS
jgi:glycosyltransferase involved in cell wall biosynthesis